jgi:hydroxypyruvate isomerase
MQFSANLGFLWADRPLPEAIRAAKAAGFDAVECHWPFETPIPEVRAALKETGLPMLGLNTRRGDPALGESGLCAVPGRVEDARASIDEAVAYATGIGAGYVHCMAGAASGPEAEAAFTANLRYALDQLDDTDLVLVIEPLNRYDAPGYFLRTTDQAVALIEALGSPRLKLMFDCYHTQITEGDVSRRLSRFLPLIGHIQIAAVPGRGAPDHGELDYLHIINHLRDIGWDRPVGAEYRPVGDTDTDLGWLARMKDQMTR